LKFYPHLLFIDSFKMATPEGFPELTFAASVPPPAGTAKTTVVPSALEGEGPRVITWQNYLWEEPKVASASDIQAAETKLNVLLPQIILHVAIEIFLCNVSINTPISDGHHQYQYCYIANKYKI
jgi:hypothetical protein